MTQKSAWLKNKKIMKHYKDSSFEIDLALDLSRSSELEDKLVHLKSGSGFPVYNSYYIDLEKYILSKINYFNNNLRKHFIVNGSRGSAVLNSADETMKHYTERFPEHQYKVTPGELFLKPACCATAFKIWQSKRTSLRKKEVMHEVSDCYRVENTGTTRTLRRNCYFTMPDYHMVTVKEDVLDDFIKVRACLFEFNQSIFGDPWISNFYQVIRVNSKSLTKYSEFLKELNESSPVETIIEQVDWSTSTPYYELKYELSYRNGPKLITLGTIQIDYLYPDLFSLDTTVLGNRPCLHFSQGSISRIMDVLIREAPAPQKGITLLCLGVDPMQQIAELGLKCAILIEDSNALVKKAIPCSYYQAIFYPRLVVIGGAELEKDTISVIDRSTKKNKVYTRKQFIALINQDLFMMESREIHYKSTFCA